MKLLKPQSRNQGFTIVELMIALSILSIILVMASVILINVGALYTKGVNGANLQNTARSIISEISANLQFSGNPPDISGSCLASAVTCAAAQSTQNLVDIHGNSDGANTPLYTFCIGTARYSYVLDQELGDDPYATVGSTSNVDVNTQHVLWRDTLPNGSSCSPLPANAFSQAQPTTNMSGYEMVPPHMRLTRFKISQQSSDSYLVDVWMAYGDSDLVVTAADGSNSCHGGTGTQFCSTSQISTTVTERVY